MKLFEVELNCHVYGQTAYCADATGCPPLLVDWTRQSVRVGRKWIPFGNVLSFTEMEPEETEEFACDKCGAHVGSRAALASHMRHKHS
jgi:hypothetical protein